MSDNLMHIGGGHDEEPEYKISDDGKSIIIDAVDDAMDPVQDFIRDKLISYGCDKKILLEIRLAVEEIFVNIISYAYRPEIGKAEILCVVEEEPMVVTIQFMDSGKPFNPLDVEDADTTGAQFLEKVGGFGIHIVKHTMDSVEYEFKDGKNILRIKKTLASE